jgi:hypothetical protein
MVGVDAFRPLVIARAGGACEYCRLLQDACGVNFHVDHVHPIGQGGATTLANLALSCPGCNLSKAGRCVGVDSDGAERPLFNPRTYDPWMLGWHLHFSLERETGRIVAQSPTGHATVEALRMNDPRRMFARKLQIEAGLIA